jgi:hypothetical protein
MGYTPQASARQSGRIGSQPHYLAVNLIAASENDSPMSKAGLGADVDSLPYIGFA